jgi:peptidoglycan/xylan/chitin deacetylase (PgdA/CDA1 family)
MGVILNFHDVKDPLWLDNIICFLQKNYNLVTMTELSNFSLNINGEKTDCHITMDDGDKTFYNVIFPILKKYKIPATIFVSPDLAIHSKNFWFQEIVGYDYSALITIFSDVTGIKKDYLKEFPVFHLFKCIQIDLIWEIINRYQLKYKPGEKPFQNLSVSELREIEHSGLIAIGAHTLRHPVLANEELQISKKEIVVSMNRLAEILGHEIDCFAYPNGIPELDFGQREIDILKEAGCKYSFSTLSGNFNLKSSFLNISRYGLSYGDSITYLKTKFLFGSHWNVMVKLKPRGEYKNRKTILKRLKNI